MHNEKIVHTHLDNSLIFILLHTEPINNLRDITNNIAFKTIIMRSCISPNPFSGDKNACKNILV
jgi:hypothetical protein